ncbi:hypothetical protein [Streptomyces sp. NPDC006274]|uniref:hypothetical protein n=1 Tax=unclassified Streptomyces TaxID=2593676 RepID=UPI0033A5FA3C
MAWDEWEELKAEAAARQESRMQLNGTGGPGGTGADAADLKTGSSGQSAAVKALVERIGPGLNKAGVYADEDTNAAERAFKGWATGAGLKDAHEEWALQVNNLKARLAQDQAALSKTKRDFQYIDHDVKSSMARLDISGPDPRRDV